MIDRPWLIQQDVASQACCIQIGAKVKPPLGKPNEDALALRTGCWAQCRPRGFVPREHAGTDERAMAFKVRYIEAPCGRPAIGPGNRIPSFRKRTTPSWNCQGVAGIDTPRPMSAAAPAREIIIMPQVPHWIGFVGLLLSLIMCGALLAQQLWLFMLLIVLGLALVVVESRYARGIPTAEH